MTHHALIPRLNLLNRLTGGLIEKIPGWVETMVQEHHQYEIMSQMQTDLRYTLSMMDRLILLADHQEQLLEWQQHLIQQLLFGFRDVANAGRHAARTAGAHQQDGAEAVEALLGSMTSAHQIVVEAFHGLQPPPIHESVASLEIVARWQMTSAPRFIVGDCSTQREEWTLLVCVFEQYAHYLAITGRDPSSARVMRLSTMLSNYPRTTNDWRTLLEQGLARFDEYILLPGDGIYDLAARLERCGELNTSEGS